MSKTNSRPITFVIKKNIPLPDPKSGGGKKYEWPFGTMAIGECFFVPVKDIHDANKWRARILNNTKAYRILGRRFASRLQPGDKEIGIWRTK